jgi:hypothetical protein
MKIKHERRKPRLSHRYRFQLLHQLLTQVYSPCRALDIGGGKGLLAYLLNQSGWRVTVVDPVSQVLPPKFRDLEKKRTKLPAEELISVPRITTPFSKELAEGFNLLIGLHAHGSNLKIIDACRKYGVNFVLLPCCVVDEPLVKKPGINWLNSLEEYAKEQGFEVKKSVLNFKGQNVVLYTTRD